MSTSDSDSEDACEVFWRTDSLLLNRVTTDPKHRPRPVAAPAPLALGTTKTPIKAKRDTTAALLPSPSTSTATLTSGAAPAARPHRLAKRRKQPEQPDPHQLDDLTRKTIGMLATRLSGRSSSSSSTPSFRETTPVPRAARASTRTVELGKGKGRELNPAPQRSLPTIPTRAQVAAPSRPSTSAPLNLPSTKPFATTFKPIITPAKPPPAPPVRAPTPAVATADSDDEFDEFDDASFELAASQLDSLDALAVASASKPKPVSPPSIVPPPALAAPKTRLLQQQQPQNRSSPRFVPLSTATRPSLPPAPKLVVQQTRTAPPAKAAVPPTRAAVKPRPPAAKPVVPAARPVAQQPPPRQSSTGGPGSGVKSAVVVRGGGAAGAKAQRELDEEAQRQIQSLLEGAEDWSDDDDL